MPVEGLPSTLEGVLSALIKEKPLTSFKIDGRGDNIVVVLRFSTGQPNDSDISSSLRHNWQETRDELISEKDRLVVIRPRRSCLCQHHSVN